MAKQVNDSYEVATFAGGCFWCMATPFDELPGIIHVVSGYTGGHKENPTYEEVCSGETGHYEAVQITYDPTLFSYEKLLGLYWPQIDPTDPNGQFINQGPSYRTAIFYHNDEQKKAAEESKRKLEASGQYDKPIVTEILPVKVFYPAEAYHQDYHKKNPEKYEEYYVRSGRKDYFSKKPTK